MFLGISLAKKLGKTRKLIVNKRRSNSKKGKENGKNERKPANINKIFKQKNDLLNEGETVGR